MEELVILAETEMSQEIHLVPTAFEPGIWRYCFCATGEILSFMDDTFNRSQVYVNNIIIDFEEYTLFDDLASLRVYNEAKGGWVNGESVIYVRFPFFHPPYLYMSKRYGILVGFTNSSPVMLENKLYKSGVLSAPVVSQETDAFSYDKMKFTGTSIDIENTKAQFDDVKNLFGNEFNLLVYLPNKEDKPNHNLIKPIEDVGDSKTVSSWGSEKKHVILIKEPEENTSQLIPLDQYYIANIVVGLEKATFHLKDKRERLSAKIPNKKFTKEEYQFIDDNLIDKEMQEVYGHCFGVPGVCLHGKQIYSIDSGQTLSQYMFRFSSAITRVDRIRVKMTTGRLPVDTSDPMGPQKDVDGWTEVYNINTGWKPGISAGNITDYLNIGVITLPWEVAKQGGERDNNINEVRMDGIFINKTTPLEIIKDIMGKYTNTPYDNRRYDLDEFNSEMSLLNHEIGIMYDKQICVYEAIERLQSGCVLGFQFHVYKNRFTIRLDNPNRSEKGVILHTDIINLDEVEIDWNTELYGSYTDIEYRYDYGEKSGRHWIDKSKSSEILEIHRVEKEWAAHTLLSMEEDARLASDILLDDFNELRPLIKNIKLFGSKWFALRMMDFYFIDFGIPGDEMENYPRGLINLIEDIGQERHISSWAEKAKHVMLIRETEKNHGKRNFAGRSLRCQILRVVSDTQTGITTIDVRVREVSKSWAA